MSDDSNPTTTRPGRDIETADGREDSKGPRTPDRIEADIERTRERLAGTIDAIGDRVAPKNVARRAMDSIKAQFVFPDGSVRVERVAPIAGFVAVIALIRTVRTLRSRR